MTTKPGRKSAASLAAVPVPLSVRRPPPPVTLGEAEATIWRDIVGAMPADWFSRESYPTLTGLCRHTARADMLADLLKDFTPEWVKVEGGLQRLDKLLAMGARETTAATACARALRLTQQARILPRGAGRAMANHTPGPRPWDRPEATSPAQT